MKKLVALLLVSLMATSAFAIVDPDSDMMGIYFDTAADQVCGSAAPITNINAYLIYTNPTLPSIRGFECQVSYVAGDNNTSITPTLAIPGTDVGVKAAPVFNFIVGYGSPLPTSAATTLATLNIFYLNFASPSMDLFLGPADPSSNLDGLPMVILDDFSLTTVGTSTDGGVAAQINAAACGVVDSEDASWGEVKSLFR